MIIAVLCLLLVPVLQGATAQADPSASMEPAATSQSFQPLPGRAKRFLFYDDDYLDYLLDDRRMPSRRIFRLAQRIDQLGLNPGQVQSLLQNLQSIQMLGSMQQLLQQMSRREQTTTQPA